MPGSTTQESEVAVVRWVLASAVPDDHEREADQEVDAPMEPAARHARGSVGIWRRTAVGGQQALISASQQIASQIDLIADEMVDALQKRHETRQAEHLPTDVAIPTWRAKDLEISFGLELTGSASVQVFSASATASATVVLRFSCTND
jgi:hypothetical protein